MSRVFSPVMENRLEAARQEQKDQLRELQRQADLCRDLLSSSGWQQIAMPYLEEWVRRATAAVMQTAATTGPEEQFLKGGAASLTELKEYIEGIVAEADRVLLELVEEDQ